MDFTLIGTLLGGVFRLVPEAISFFDKKNERQHELEMFDRQLEADKLKAANAKEQAVIEAEKALVSTEYQALVEATKAQAGLTGTKWVDAINSLMRPLITFWWVIVLYTWALAAQFLVLQEQGVAGKEALLQLWGSPEKSIVASILSFWFVDRALRKLFK
jgi:hypothetical protein